jgi:hypothetical protein
MAAGPRVIATADPDTIACPRCGLPVRGDQEWCLSCGAAARTRLVPTPGWRAPVAVFAVVAVLGVLLLTWAFVALTRDEDPAPASRPATPAAPAQP